MPDKDKSDSPPLTAGLSERISRFEQSQNTGNPQNQRGQMSSSGLAMAGRVTVELVAGLVVGAAIGWGLDKVLGTTPLMMVIMFFLGAIAGMMNVWRSLTGRGMAAGFFDEKCPSEAEKPRDGQKNRSD